MNLDVQKNYYSCVNFTDFPKVFKDFRGNYKPCFSVDEDSFVLHEDAEKSEIKENFELIKNKQGFIGKLWDGFKNKLNLNNSSNQVEKTIDSFRKNEVSKQEALKAIEKYTKGQTKALDFIADWSAASISAITFAIALSAFTAGVPAALGCAALAGGIFKMGVKYLDSKSGKRKYNTSCYDFITGAINGLLSPLANGFGNAVVKTSAKKLGIKSVSSVSTSALKEKTLSDIIKTLALYPSQKLEGGFLKRKIVTLVGSATKGFAKSALSFGLRGITFGYISLSNLSAKKQKEKFNYLLKISGIEDDKKKILNEAMSKTRTEIDISNNVYDTGA